MREDHQSFLSISSRMISIILEHKIPHLILLIQNIILIDSPFHQGNELLILMELFRDESFEEGGTGHACFLVVGIDVEVSD